MCKNLLNINMRRLQSQRSNCCGSALSFISSRPAGLSHSISRMRQNEGSTSSKQCGACVRATHHRSCVVVSEELPLSQATYSDKPILLCWSKLLLSQGGSHPPTHLTTHKLQANRYDRQIKQGAVLKMQQVGISFVRSPASLANWLIKLE